MTFSSVCIIYRCLSRQTIKITKYKTLNNYLYLHFNIYYTILVKYIVLILIFRNIFNGQHLISMRKCVGNV